MSPFVVGGTREAWIFLHEGLCCCKGHQGRRPLFLLPLHGKPGVWIDLLCSSCQVMS